MEIFDDIFKMLYGMISEVFSGLGEILPKVFSFIFWFLAGILILPCVFVSAQLYPKWQKWGEKL